MGSPSDLMLERWKSGQNEALGELFDRYRERLVRLASAKLPSKLRASLKEEVFQSACRCFLRAVAKGRYHSLERGSDLRDLLVVITLNKARRKTRDCFRHDRAVREWRRRHLGFRPNRTDSKLSSFPENPIDELEFDDEVKLLVKELKPLASKVLEFRLAGRSYEEIGILIGRSERTVYRVLQEIKNLMEERAREFVDSD